MNGIQCLIDLDWLSSDHIVRVEWVFFIQGKSLQVTYGCGKFGMTYAAGSKYWPPVQSNPGITLTPDASGAYLGWGRPLYMDRAVWPLSGEGVQQQANSPYPYGYLTQYGYKFPKVVTGTESDDNILLTLYIDGNNTTISCNGMTLTTQLFPDLADSDSFIPWGLVGTETVPLTPDQGSIHELQPDLSIISCNLSIFNQGGQSLVYPGGTQSASYWYGDTFAQINSITWSRYTPTDDSAYLTKVNTAVTYDNRLSHPAILKTGYWYSGGAHLVDLQDGVVADTEGSLVAPLSGSWSQTYQFPSMYPGRGFTSFPTGAESVFRSIISGSSNVLQFFSRQSEDSEWVAKTGFTEGSANVIPKFLAQDNTTDQATWDDYQWGKKYTTLYSIDTFGNNFTQCAVDHQLLAKGPRTPTVLGYRNRWDANISNTFTSLSYSSTYTDNMSENLKQLRYWANDDLLSTSYRYTFPMSDFYFDGRLDLGACGVVGDPDYGTSSTTAVAFCNSLGSTTTIATISGGYVEPWLWQHDDGTWVVNWFNDGDFFSYKGSDRLGGTFTEYHTQVGDYNLHNIQKLRLSNGAEIIAGFSTTAGTLSSTLTGYYRTGWTEDWQGPYLNSSQDYPLPLYITERTTGDVELGMWDYSTATWSQWTTNDSQQDLTAWDSFTP